MDKADDRMDIFVYIAEDVKTGLFYKGNGYFGKKAKVFNGKNHIRSSFNFHGIDTSNIVIYKCDLITVEVEDG